MNIKIGDRVFFGVPKKIGTVTHIYNGNDLIDVKSCGEFYTFKIVNVEPVPKDWTPRWR